MQVDMGMLKHIHIVIHRLCVKCGIDLMWLSDEDNPGAPVAADYTKPGQITSSSSLLSLLPLLLFPKPYS